MTDEPFAASQPEASTKTKSRDGSVVPLTPATMAGAFLILMILPEVKLRTRSAAASFSGKLDLQVAFEIAIYMLVAAWFGRILVRRLADRTYSPTDLGPTGKALIGVAAVVVVSSASAISERSALRGVQFAIITAAALFVIWESRRVDGFFAAIWTYVRRGYLGFATVATIATFGNPAWGVHSSAGVPRYAWLEMHPIVTGGMLGLGLLMLASLYLGQPDPLVQRRGWRLLTAGLGAAFLVQLLMTKARGATAATLVALLVLVLLSRRGRARAGAVLLMAFIAALLPIYFNTEAGSQQLEAFVFREQTVEQVQSLSQRTDLIEIGRELFAEEPIFGHGYLLTGPIFVPRYPWAGHGHNVAVEIGVAMGLVGLAAFSWLLITAIRGLVRGWRHAVERRLHHTVEAVAVLALLLGQGMISDGFGGAVGWEVGGLLLTVLAADVVGFVPGTRLRGRPEAAVASYGRSPG